MIYDLSRAGKHGTEFVSYLSNFSTIFSCLDTFYHPPVAVLRYPVFSSLVTLSLNGYVYTGRSFLHRVLNRVKLKDHKYINTNGLE